jgi:hypothetical protein
MTELARLTGIFWDPKPVYEDLAARPRWWAPILLTTVIALAYLAAFSHRIGWEQFLEQEFRTNSRLQQIPVEQQREIIARQAKIVGVTSYAGAALGTLVVCVAVAGVFLFAFRTFGGAELSFRQSLSVTAYSFLPNALASALAIVVVTQADPADFDLRNPLMLNAAWLAPPEGVPAWLRTLAASLDLFSIWTLLLLALGYSVAARKVRYAKSLALVLAVWGAYVALKVAWSALLG